MSTVIPVIQIDLLMKAWTGFTLTADYLNILSRVTILEDSESSLFVAFSRGFQAGESTKVNHGNAQRG